MQSRSSRYEKHNYLEERQKDLNSEEETIVKDEEKITEEPKKHPLLKKIFIIFILFLTSFFIYSKFIERKIITIKEYKIESKNIPQNFSGLKLVHFSDIHYGTTIDQKELKKIVAKINELKPDIIFFTGDLIDKNINPTEEMKNELIEILKDLDPKLYKYACYGDEDLDNKYYAEILDNSNFILLNNTSTLLYFQSNNPIEIIGLSNNKQTDYSIISENKENIANLYKIVLSHEPDLIDKFIKYKPDLVLSGHTLGGIIKFPYLKPIFLRENCYNYYNSYTKINNTELYISNGLGTSNINLRFNNYPSINLYRIYNY